MNKTEIQTILQNPYNRNVWIEFLRPTFGGSYRSNAPTITLPNNEIADFAYEIGQFTTTDNMLVGVYEVKIKEGISIENKRVGLRNLLKSVYRVVDAALIVFDTGDAWRFSYVSEIYTRDEAGNRQHLKTDPKRFTYVLGTGGGVRTATERFVELSKKSLQIKLKDLNDVFSVEILTKKFYQDLSNWYFWALTKVKFPDDAEPNDEIRNATSVIRLITRLMFVWFLKQKHLVRDELFEEETLRKILKNFNPKDGEISSVFYKAILQNLFFATLNTEMMDDKRKFISRQTGVQGFYRYERYFQNKELFLELSKETPFLNGGLFENLDRNIGETNEIRIDCFSNRISNENRLIIPDSLFFGEEVVDLSGVYDDKKRKSVAVKGLINILKSYNFTVEENTPTDIEVALDPELLGKVFENLLASYNPETKTTARKQTGSFYTPREIVEYMVDESLKTYLSENLLENRNKGFQKLGANQAHLFGNEGVKGQLDLVAPIADSTEEIIKESLENLFSYANENNLFDEANTQTLIRAIDKCRILDPACGSGAFPMGILQRLVFLLRKLDPQNLYWREQQIKRATKDFETALRAGQAIDLQAQIQEISETFANNTDDYGRKLYLIENCIYGVDIQPIAVQIAKLRFFISLMAEQNPLQQGANRGIRPLPNLETKFVAANTLIGLEKPTQLLLKNTAIDILENQLEEVRHKHFFARTPETKKKYRLKDQELRNEIAQLLSKDGWKPTSANQVAAWNPYDQSTYAPFFDPEWMFGIIDGFDIVIGNPPYVPLQNNGGLLSKTLENQGYITFERTGDIYVVFYEQGIKILKRNGLLCFITSNKWMRTGYGKSLRKFFSEKTNPIQLIDFAGQQVFEGATVDTNILLAQKSKNKYLTKACIIKEKCLDSLNDYINQNGIIFHFSTSENWVILSPIEQRIKEKIERVGIPLRDWDINIYRGILTGYNEAFIIDGTKKDELIAADPKSAEIIRPILRGRDIKRYGYNFADLWLINTHNGIKEKGLERIKIDDYPIIKEHLDRFNVELEKRADQGDTLYNLRNCAYTDDFFKPKIIFQEIVQEPSFIYDIDNNFLCLDTGRIIVGEKLNYLLAILNSKLFFFAVKTFYGGGALGATGIRMKHTYFENFPCPLLPENLENKICQIVNEIIDKKKHNLPWIKIEEVLNKYIYEIYNLDREEVNFISSL